MRRGVRIGVDVGSVRVGVARSDPDGILATPAVTLARGQNDLAELVRLVDDESAIEVIVGYPVGLSGTGGLAAEAARAYAEELATLLGGTPVRLVDERLSTVSAHSQMRASGKTTRQTRSVIDQSAAAIILQSALDAERSRGEPAGHLVQG